MADKDETKGTPRDESGKGTPKKDESKGTPKGKLYTAAEIDKIKSDSANMGQGRAEKAANQEKEALTSELQSTKSRLDALEAQGREARLAEARGDSTKMRAFQSEETLATERRKVEDLLKDVTRREGQVKAREEEADVKAGAFSVAYIAAKHGLDVERLEKLGITDLDTLEKVAEEMKPVETKGEGDKDEEGDKGGEGLKLDTGEGSGSGEKTDEQRLKERYPTM